MIEQAGGAALGVEARADHRVLLQGSVQHLDGDRLREMEMPRAIHDAERTTADAALDEEASTQRASEQRVVPTMAGGTKRRLHRR